MRLKPTGVIDDTRTGHDLSFEQTQATEFLPGTFEGAVVLAAPFNATSEDLALTKANGNRVQTGYGYGRDGIGYCFFGP